ncbi:ABC transporter substrate-binding protein [Propioniciclava soli]|uniref:ABC transporter substrate-binding protein n=1 Tax=Propioniciclava soli TaxID=2775081 RepID=UPI001E3B04DA|nr:ABC transporter substrate-binding protein [Propioniciclava soli]
MREARATGRAVALAALASVALGACTQPAPAPEPSPEPSPTASAERPFTVVTTQAPATFDPAAATTAADAIVALNVFSRLMVVHPEASDLKPDLATDCLYTSPTTYRCQLPEDLTFHNGHALTSSDVKFSIERAYRLGAPASSVRLLDALERVEAVDDETIDFVLKWADTQFGYALATPAASIVDEELYDPDAVRPNEGQAVGSGPYQLVTTAADRLVFQRYEEYRGATTGVIDTVELRMVADSAAAEALLVDDEVDVAWRSLNAAARDRLAAASASEPGVTRLTLEQARLQTLAFNPAGARRDDPTLRAAVATALQPDRTVGSLVPPAVTGSAATFAVGGTPEVPQIPGQRLVLTLAYDPAAPDQRDLAGLVRDRLEARGGMSVQLVTDAASADLVLADGSAWVNTAFGWLQPYVDAPLPGSAEKVATLLQAARATTDPLEREALLGEVQAQAAVDLTVVPIAVGDEVVFMAEGVSVEGSPFGPGWQLGLWSFRR